MAPSHGLTSSVIVSCVAYGLPLPTISWQQNGITLSGAHEVSQLIDGIPVLSSSLELCPMEEGIRSGNYACQVGNGVINSLGRTVKSAVIQLCFIGQQTVQHALLC